MSLNILENAIVKELKEIIKNSKFTKNNIMEWSTGDIKPEEGEIVVQLPVLKINVAFKKELDKRG